MIHPTRTNLLLLKEKARSVSGSIGILKARRLALIRELLATSTPFLRSRDEVRQVYAQALDELHLALGNEGEASLESLAAVTGRDLGVEITEQSCMGLRYRELLVIEDPVRLPDQRGYDFRLTTPHLEESFQLFETIIVAMLAIAAYENKLQKLGEEIARVTRRNKVLEERILPGLQREIRGIGQYLSERERESFYRLKRFKEIINCREGSTHG
ncbi:MAG TPA: V-type ATP synthase subunit D [Geobacteraceae bacterium]